MRSLALLPLALGDAPALERGEQVREVVVVADDRDASVLVVTAFCAFEG